jgi:hypothetical protein
MVSKRHPRPVENCVRKIFRWNRKDVADGTYKKCDRGGNLGIQSHKARRTGLRSLAFDDSMGYLIWRRPLRDHAQHDADADTELSSDLEGALPVPRRSRIRCSTLGLVGRRPSRTPFALARARPALTRSRIIARSNFADRGWCGGERVTGWTNRCHHGRKRLQSRRGMDQVAIDPKRTFTS